MSKYPENIFSSLNSLNLKRKAQMEASHWKSCHVLVVLLQVQLYNRNYDANDKTMEVVKRSTKKVHTKTAV